MVNKYYQKTQKDSENKHVKDIKIFLQKEKIEAKKDSRKISKFY